MVRAARTKDEPEQPERCEEWMARLPQMKTFKLVHFAEGAMTS